MLPNYLAQPEGEGKHDEAYSNATYSLLIPGKILNLSALNHLKRLETVGTNQELRKGGNFYKSAKL